MKIKTNGHLILPGHNQVVRPLSTIDFTKLTYSRTLKMAKVTDTGGSPHLMIVLEDTDTAHAMNGIDEMKRFHEMLGQIIGEMESRN